MRLSYVRHSLLSCEFGATPVPGRAAHTWSYSVIAHDHTLYLDTVALCNDNLWLHYVDTHNCTLQLQKQNTSETHAWDVLTSARQDASQNTTLYNKWPANIPGCQMQRCWPQGLLSPTHFGCRAGSNGQVCLLLGCGSSSCAAWVRFIKLRCLGAVTCHCACK